MVTVRDRLESLAVDFADGALTSDQLRAITRRLRGRLDELQRIVAAADRGDVLGRLVGSSDAGDLWATLSLEARRQVIDTLVDVPCFLPRKGEGVSIRRQYGSTGKRRDSRPRGRSLPQAPANSEFILGVRHNSPIVLVG